jgi:hypothetical protein
MSRPSLPSWLPSSEGRAKPKMHGYCVSSDGLHEIARSNVLPQADAPKSRAAELPRYTSRIDYVGHS